MATYKINDLLKQLLEIAENGHEYVEIFESDANEEEGFPAHLSFDAFETLDGVGYIGIGYDGVYACEVPDFDAPPEEVELSPSDTCYQLLFSYKEIGTIRTSIANSLHYYKIISADKTVPREQRDEVRFLSTEALNLQAKLDKFFKRRKD